jgi:hypothetical protein
MLALSGIQVGKHHHRQALPGRLTQQLKRKGVSDPGRPVGCANSDMASGLPVRSVMVG